MKIKIIALGKIKEKFLKDGIEEFMKRLTPYASVEIIELSPIEIKDENLTAKVLAEELGAKFGTRKIQRLLDDINYEIEMEEKYERQMNSL